MSISFAFCKRSAQPNLSEHVGMFFSPHSTQHVELRSGVTMKKIADWLLCEANLGQCEVNCVVLQSLNAK